MEEEQVHRCLLERGEKGGSEKMGQKKGEEMGFKYKSRYRAQSHTIELDRIKMHSTASCRCL